MPRPSGRLTHNRQLVLAEIEHEPDHLTANEILMRVRRRNPRIAYGSVYNALKFLTQAGYVHEFHFGARAARYDRNTDRHDHTVCTKCGKLTDISVELPKGLAETAAAAQGFLLQTHHVELYGLCGGCR